MARQQTLENFLNQAREAIISDQQAKGIRASGDSANSLRVEINEDLSGGRIYGAGYFRYQSTGRKLGGFPPVEAILDWIRAKGITAEEDDERGLAFAIATKIAKSGTDIYQGKRPGLSIEQALDKLREDLSKNLLKDTGTEVIDKIKTAFK